MCIRDRYNRIGWIENRLYHGIKELLKDLKASGAKLSTASSKPKPALELIVQHFGILEYFDALVAAGPDGFHSSKPEMIEQAIRDCGGAQKQEDVYKRQDLRSAVRQWCSRLVLSQGLSAGSGIYRCLLYTSRCV